MPPNDTRPLFYDIYMRPGAIYWLKNEFGIDRDGDGESEIWPLGWDFNYFTFDFNFINTGDIYKETTSDACFVRCVEYER